MSQAHRRTRIWRLASGLAAVAALAIASGLIPVPAHAQDGTSLNDYKCYAIKPDPLQGTFQRRQLQITDQFGERSATIVRPFELCTPVDKSGEGIEDPEAHLACYKVSSRQRDPWRILADIDQFTVRDTAGELLPEDLIVGRAAEVCFPALKDCEVEDEETCDVTELEESLSHYQCYQARSLAKSPVVPGILELEDQFGATSSDVSAATKHCNPLESKALDGNEPEELTVVEFPDPTGVSGAFWEAGDEVHYKCYGLLDETRVRFSSVEIRDQLHPDGLAVRVGNAVQLCEPAVKPEPEEPDE